ncbi:MopE-related protein [Kaarinaea lacus]
MSGNKKTLLFLSALVPALFVLAIAPPAFSAGNVTGTIKGKVDYCGKGGYLGMQVFIPGRQFMVLLGMDGNFIFDGVPAGNYDINYAINGQLVNENKNVSVSAGGTNDLGNIVFCADNKAPAAQPAKDPCEENPNSADCVDADKDGVVAAKDCDDNNASVKPGAIEKCDGIDNNCNGEIDEQSMISIANGTGSCESGKVSKVLSCNKGFEDCDKDPSNGCETDIYNDRENCGSCGNECSVLESCDLGIC